MRLLPGEKYVYAFEDPDLGKLKIEQIVEGRRGGCMVVNTTIQNMSIPFCLDEKTGEAKTSGEWAQASPAGPGFTSGEESKPAAGPWRLRKR